MTMTKTDSNFQTSEAVENDPFSDQPIIQEVGHLNPDEVNPLLFAAMRTRENYNILAPVALRAGGLLKTLTQDIGEWYETSGLKELNADSLQAMLEVKHRFWPDAAWESVNRLVDYTTMDFDDAYMAPVLAALAEQNLKCFLGDLASAEDSGKSIVNKLKDGLEQYAGSFMAKEDLLVRDSIMDLIAEETREDGIRWPLASLSLCMRPLRPGDFGIVAAPPDAGKSSFVAFLLKHFAGQLQEGDKIMWLNNEGKGSRLKLRLVQATLEKDLDELVGMEYNKPGCVEEAFAQQHGHKIEVYDIHTKQFLEIEQMIQESKPRIVVFDMLDNVELGEAYGDLRHDLKVELLYKKTRNIAVTQNIIVIATSQISHEGHGMEFPPQSALKDSKTGKQGTADFILMFGQSKDPLKHGSRYLSLTKNKLERPTGKKDPRAEVEFDTKRCGFKDVSDDIVLGKIDKNGNKTNKWPYGKPAGMIGDYE